MVPCSSSSSFVGAGRGRTGAVASGGGGACRPALSPCPRPARSGRSRLTLTGLPRSLPAASSNAPTLLCGSMTKACSSSRPPRRTCAGVLRPSCGSISSGLPLPRACSISTARSRSSASAGSSSREIATGLAAATCMASFLPSAASSSPLPAVSSATSTPMRPIPGASSAVHVGGDHAGVGAHRIDAAQGDVLADRGGQVGDLLADGPPARRPRGGLERIEIAADAPRQIGNAGYEVPERVVARDEVGLGVHLDHRAVRARQRKRRPAPRWRRVLSALPRPKGPSCAASRPPPRCRRRSRSAPSCSPSCRRRSFRADP